MVGCASMIACVLLLHWLAFCFTRAFPYCVALFLALLLLSFTHFFKESTALVARGLTGWLAAKLAC